MDSSNNTRDEDRNRTDSTEPNRQPKENQQKTDPQLTELKGFTDSKEDLEPTLVDGTKSPEKGPER
jgi:hypothetical protein